MNRKQIMELTGIQKEDFTVESNGEVYLATRKVGVLLGVPESTLRGWIKRNRQALNLNEKNQLDPKSLVFVAKLAQSKYKQSAVFLDRILVGGCNQVLQNLVGYTPKQMTQGEQLVANAQMLLEMEKALEKKADTARVEQLEKSVRGNQCPYRYLPMQKMADFFGVSNTAKFRETVKQARSCEYPFSSGMGGLRKATAYHIEDVRIMLEG